MAGLVRSQCATKQGSLFVSAQRRGNWHFGNSRLSHIETLYDQGGQQTEFNMEKKLNYSYKLKGIKFQCSNLDFIFKGSSPSSF